MGGGTDHNPAAETAQLRPTSETGIYLHKHEHQWEQVGAKRYRAGSWHPVFTCVACGDVICDLHVEVDVFGQVVVPPGVSSEGPTE